MERREFLGVMAVSAISPKTIAFAQTDDRFEELAKLIESKMAEYHVPASRSG